jgi:hypothetical protein
MTNDEKLEPSPKMAAFLASIANTFLSDIREAENRMRRPDATDFDRKTYIRTFFAYVEGLIGSIKDAALAAKDPHRTPAELAMLREETYFLDEKGRAEKKRALLNIKANVLFAFRVMGRGFGVHDFAADTSVDGWRAFSDAVAIRNRLTHPRSLDQSRVTLEDVATVEKAEKWYSEQHAAFSRRLLAGAPGPPKIQTPPPQPKP